MTDLPSGVAELVERAFRALDPYREDLVLVGGLVPFLYLAHPEVRAPAFAPLATNDLDLAIPRRLPARHARTLRDLLDEHGFHTREIPGFYDTVSQYTFSLGPPGRGRPHHLEFLAPLRGPEPRRPLLTQVDLPLWPLRYVDLLRAAPMRIEHDRLGIVQVPHPLTYVVQKALIRGERRTDDRRIRDQGAIFWTVLAFEHGRRHWQHVHRRLGEQRHEWGAWIRRGLLALERLYLQSRDGADEVVMAFGDRLGNGVVSEVVGAFLDDMRA